MFLFFFNRSDYFSQKPLCELRQMKRIDNWDKCNKTTLIINIDTHKSPKVCLYRVLPPNLGVHFLVSTYYYISQEPIPLFKVMIILCYNDELTIKTWYHDVSLNCNVESFFATIFFYIVIAICFKALLRSETIELVYDNVHKFKVFVWNYLKWAKRNPSYPSIRANFWHSTPQNYRLYFGEI